MRFTLLHPGTAGRGPLADAAADYLARLRRNPALEVGEVFVKPVKLRRESDAEVQQALDTEASRVLAKLSSSDLVVALDRTGEAWSSAQWANAIRRWRDDGRRVVALVLGSPHGLSRQLLKRADKRLSFGPLTLPHELARVVLWEQVYRAHAIIAGTPYHK